MRRFGIALAASLLLLAQPARADRIVKVLSDVTSTTGGSVDTGTLGTYQCDTLLVTVTAGTATTCATTMYQIDESKPATCPATGCVQIGTVATVSVGTPDKSLSLGITSTTPVPKLTRIVSAAGASGTVRVRVECGSWRS